MCAREVAKIPADIAVVNWSALRQGDTVLFEFTEGRQSSAIVDEVFPKGNILWIWPLQSFSRQLIQLADVKQIRCRTADFNAARLAGLLQEPRPSFAEH